MFDALETSIAVQEQLAPLEAKIRQHRKTLAEQIAKAVDSIALNLAEGRCRAGQDRVNHFRIAAGSAGELTAGLRLAQVRGYITAAEYAAIDESLDRVRAMLWALTH